MKTKWLQFYAPSDLKRIRQALHSCPFTRDGTLGFELVERQDDAIVCRYIERVAEQELITDPFGDEQIIETLRYDVINFTIIDRGLSFFIMKIDDPGRSIKRFLQKLYDLLGFGTAVRPVMFDVRDMVRSLKKSGELRLLKVERAKVTGVSLSATGTARVEVISNSDAIRELAKAFNLSNACIEKACIRFASRDGALTAEISRTGMMNYPSGFATTFSNASIKYIIENIK